MKYKINNTVDYNASDGTLFSADNMLDIITLNRMCNEILTLFMKNSGVPLSRDFILNEIWEKRGLSASSNNLNNYISMLRKALAECGCPDVITTIPKHGFLFNAEIISAPLPELQSHQPPALATNDCEDAVEALAIPVKSKRRKHISLRLVATLVIAVVLAGYIIKITRDLYSLNMLKSEISYQDQCHFFAIDDITRRMYQAGLLSRIKSIISQENINCSLKANVYYSVDSIRDVSGNFNISELLSYCAHDSNAPCENFTFIRSESENELQK